MNDKMQKLKDLLAEKRTEIRNTKIDTKEYQRKHGGCCGGLQWTLMSMRSDYRHHHIAYSELLGRKREEIEAKVTRGNEYPFQLNESKIKSIKEEYHEDVCLSAE